MKWFLVGLMATVVALWATLFYQNGMPSGDTLWILRYQGLYLSGVLSMMAMSLVMLLATRPAWLERPFGGMDKLYRLHKWAGISAIIFAAIHWLIEMSDDIIKGLIGKAGRPPKELTLAWFDSLRGLSKDMGEWAIYLLLAMLVLTLWKRFPYRFWQFLHRIMPIIYLMLVLHTLCLAPLSYWMHPLGWALLFAMTVGVWASVVALTGRIGRSKRHQAKILNIHTLGNDVTEVICQLNHSWPTYQPGQFAYVTFNRVEGAHPFTVVGVNDRNHVRFQIKGLGDYTKGLAKKLSLGATVSIEGPYGCFTFNDRIKKQIWIGAGIGITPFIAGLQGLHNHGAQSIHLYYCPSAQPSLVPDPFESELIHSIAGDERVTLRVIKSEEHGYLSARQLIDHHPDLADYHIWFCGPTPFADALLLDLKRLGYAGVKVHRELFEMR